MTSSEHDLRALFLASLAAPPGPDCPPPEAIWDALNLALPAARRYAIILHTATCPHCAQAWQAARLIDDERRREESSPVPAERWWSRWLRPPVLVPALGGVAALLVAMVWLGPRQPGPVAPPVDSGVVRGISGAPELVTPDGTALGAGDELSWRGTTGATHHKVVMVSATGDRRLELPATDGLVLGQEVIETFGPGGTVFWYVVAIDGTSPGAESEVRRFSLIGGP